MKIPQLSISDDDVKSDVQAWQYFRQRDFTGGENRLLLPESLQPNQLQLAYNCIISADGLPETRTGKSAIFTTPLASSITSIHRFSTEAGAEKILIQSGTVMYMYAYDGSTVFNAPTSIATGLNAAKFRSVTWKNKIYLTNGVDNVKSYDGTTWGDLAGSPPKSKIIKIYGGRLYLVDVANPNNLRFSDLENPAVWDALNLVNIRSGDSDWITAISPQRGGLVVFKNNSVWVLYGTSLSTFKLSEAPIAENIGCVATDSLLDEGVFLGRTNIYTFSLNGVQAVADTHRNVIEVLSLATKQAAFASYDREKKRVLMHLDSFILCLDQNIGCITTWSNLNAACFADLNAGDDDGAILAGDKTIGMVYKLDSSKTDAGIPINSQIFTAYLDYGIIGKKLWRYFAPEMEFFDGATTPVRYEWDIDYSKDSDLLNINVDSPADTTTWDVDNWDEANWAGDTFRLTDTFYIHRALGNRIAFKITALDRIRFLGYVTKFREQGAL